MVNVKLIEADWNISIVGMMLSWKQRWMGSQHYLAWWQLFS